MRRQLHSTRVRGGSLRTFKMHRWSLLATSSVRLAALASPSLSTGARNGDRTLSPAAMVSAGSKQLQRRAQAVSGGATRPRTSTHPSTQPSTTSLPTRGSIGSFAKCMPAEPRRGGQGA